MTKTKWYTRPIYLLGALALVLSLGIAALPESEVLWAHPGTIQVDVNDPGCVNASGQSDPYSVVYCSIQDAIDDASSGDTINVAAGTYSESIPLKGGVQVLGAGADVTTIDGSTARDGQPAYHVVVGANNAVLDGFNVTGGNANGAGSNGHGGGMYNNYSSPTVTNCIFQGNSAYWGGGMYNVNGSDPGVTNCIFQGNSAYQGGGMFGIHYSDPRVTNCIFSGNSATAGGGMYNINDCRPRVTNCIFWDDSQEIGNERFSSPVVTYCDIKGYTGPTNIHADPMFVDPAHNDYHLQADSPCIDAGTNDGAPSEDMDGNRRPIDGDGDGWPITDMGAYEYMLPPPPPDFGYLHSQGSLIDLAHPVGTQWHELWPVFCKGYHLRSWEDNGDGVLSRCDQIDMYQKPDGEVRWYHVENVTITLLLTHNETGEPKYIDLESGYNVSVLKKPVDTQWHEIYPAFCREYHLSSWNDTDESGELDFCDTIELTDKWTGVAGWWHVEDVATDIVVTPEPPPPPPPPPVGGEAYPVSRLVILAPWIAFGAAIMAGASILLRRRRTQS